MQVHSTIMPNANVSPASEVTVDHRETACINTVCDGDLFNRQQIDVTRDTDSSKPTKAKIIKSIDGDFESGKQNVNTTAKPTEQVKNTNSNGQSVGQPRGTGRPRKSKASAPPLPDSVHSTDKTDCCGSSTVKQGGRPRKPKASTSAKQPSSMASDLTKKDLEDGRSNASSTEVVKKSTAEGKSSQGSIKSTNHLQYEILI